MAHRELAGKDRAGSGRTLDEFISGSTELKGDVRRDASAKKERSGKKFNESPYIEGHAVHYHWPNENDSEFRKIFMEKKDSIAQGLFEKAKKYMEDFDLGRMLLYSSLIIYDKAIGINIGWGGRWVTFGHESSFALMVDAHNLDWPNELIVAFNLTSDLLEELDPEVLAPRIRKDRTVEYYLPKGTRLLRTKNNSTLEREWVERVMDEVELGRFVGLTLEKGKQTFNWERGSVTIQDGVCKSSGFDTFSLPVVTYVIAKLIDAGS